MCGFKGKAVMSSGINDTARCAPATARITAVNWGCNGLLFQARADEEQDSIISKCITGKQGEDVQPLLLITAVV